MENNLFFNKIYPINPRKEIINLNQEIYLRQKIIADIKKNIESQLLIKDDIQDLPNNQQDQKFNNNPLFKNKPKIKKKIIKNILNKKINIGPMALFDLLKKRNSLYIENEKRLNSSSSKNVILSSFKNDIINENKKLMSNNIKERKDKMYFTHKINNNFYSSATELNNIGNNNENFNNTYFKDKNLINNNINAKKMIKRNISWNSAYNIKNNINNNHEKNIFNSYYNNINNNEQSSNFPNWTTRNKKQISYPIINLINTSDFNNNSNYYYISNYSEKKNNITDKNIYNNPSTPRNPYVKDSFQNLNSDLSNITNISNLNYQKSKFGNTTPSKSFFTDRNKNKTTNIFNSEGNNKQSKKSILKKQSNSKIFKKIKTKIIKAHPKARSNNIFKKISKNFKTSFNRKVKSLNNITKTCNTELIRLIDKNSKENDENFISSKTKKMEEVKNELDIRNDIIDKNDKNSIVSLNEGKLEKYKILMNNVKIEMNLSGEEDKKIINILKKKINIISDTIALNIIEKNLGIKRTVGFDINELFNEHIKKKKSIEKFKIQKIRKKAEENYFKMVKLRKNLSGNKIFKSVSNEKSQNNQSKE